MIKQIGMKQLAAGVVALAVVLVGAWYLALIRPESHKLTAAHSADAAAQSQISQLDGEISQLNVYKDHLSEDKSALAQFEQEIPATPDLSGIIRQIQGAANTANVQLTSLDPTVESGASAISVGGASVIPVSIDVNGTYDNLMSFTNALTSMTRTLVINSVSLSGSGAALSDSMSADIFYTGSSSSSSNQ